MNPPDVLVVGGGPAGAAVAIGCAQRGRRVVLLEQKKFPRPKICGDVLNPNCWPVLERLGVAAAVRALPHHRITGVRFTTPGGGNLSFPVEAVAVRRSVFDACLLDHARAAGVEVIEERWSPSHPSAAMVVGADGRHSAVARATGLAQPQPPPVERIAFQSHFRIPPGLGDDVQLHLFPGGYCGLVRVDPVRLNLCIVTNRAGAQAHQDCPELFRRTVWHNPQFRELGIAPEPLDPLQSAQPLWTRPHTPARDGVLLVGDALRVVEPFTGQGIFFALRTGELAAELMEPAAYTHAVRALYQQRARTNKLLRELMYRPGLADWVLPVLRRWPTGLQWLAGNVLAP